LSIISEKSAEEKKRDLEKLIEDVRNKNKLSKKQSKAHTQTFSNAVAKAIARPVKPKVTKTITVSTKPSKPSGPDEQPCPICHIKYNKHYMKIHIRTHTGEKPYPCRFPTCHQSFINKNSLERHSLVHYSETFDCPICDHKLRK